MQDAGWDKARVRYENFVQAHRRSRILYLELGVGGNTPVIIKYPFWRFTLENPKAVYACINYSEAFCPPQIEKRSVCIDGDVGKVIGHCCKAAQIGFSNVENFLQIRTKSVKGLDFYNNNVIKFTSKYLL